MILQDNQADDEIVGQRISSGLSNAKKDFKSWRRDLPPHQSW
jgi:hypothetical protein